MNQAKEGRLHILKEMSKTMKSSRSDLKAHTPRSHKMSIPKDMIGAKFHGFDESSLITILPS